MNPPRRHVAMFVLGMAVTAVLLLLAYAILSAAVTGQKVRDTQLEGTPTGKKLVAASDRILDCTSPEGDCYKRSQKRTASAVGDIGAANILAVVCALQVPNGTPLNDALEQVSACVADRLADTKRTP